MPVEKLSDRIVLKHSKGASAAEILLYGATVISWKSGTKKDPQPSERLFVSSKAALDGSKPVRGGIPIVFPCFGPPSHPEHLALSQHGFARNSVWSYDSTVLDNDAGVSVRLTLDPTAEITKVFKKPFHLAFVVTLAEHQLSTDLHVTNKSTETGFPPDNLTFQALFHTYIRAPASQVLVSALQNVKYYDKTEATEEGKSTPKSETRAGVDVKKYTDSVYEDAPGKYEVSWPGGGLEINATQLKDLVVWNPGKEAGSKLGDMEDGGWERYICVEPGVTRSYIELPPSKTWIGQQVLSVIHE